jgi:cytochrome o ubiquinol oxidase subunit 2
VTVEAVAMNWKWLFIYPELKIATVNQLALPVNTPVNFKITSDSIMNSFFIPQLGSQVYAMAGMETKLHLIANEAGTFDGMSANYSGGGFSGMKFKAIAMSNFEFDKWVEKVRASSKAARVRGLQGPGQAERSGTGDVLRQGRRRSVHRHPASVHGRRRPCNGPRRF